MSSIRSDDLDVYRYLSNLWIQSTFMFTKYENTFMIVAKKWVVFLTSPKLKRTGTLRKIINNQIAKCAHMRVCVCMCVVCLYITMLRRKRHEDKWPCKCIISDACSSAKIVKRSSDKVCPSYSSFKPFESLNSLEVFCYMK